MQARGVDFLALLVWFLCETVVVVTRVFISF